VRPEHLEDASVVGSDVADRGRKFNAQVDLIEMLGAENYAYFHLEGTRVESDQLSELAADAGLGEVPSAASGETAFVARLDPASDIKKEDLAELWVDASNLHLFDPESGRSLTADGR
jgi:multiple sugar transport system ATP-binding protein